MSISPVAFNTLSQRVDDLSDEVQELATTVGDDVQELQNRTDTLELAVIGADIRIVPPPEHDRSDGRVGEIAFDASGNFYIYIGNNTTHRWGVTPLITEFIRENL
jgi:hypothetical protein